MSIFALFRDPNTGEEKYVLARNCSSADYGLSFFCPSCDAPMTLRKSHKGNYFFGGSHNAGCDIATVSRGKTIILPDGYQVPLDTILGAEDRPIVPPPPPPPPGPDGKDGPNEDPEPDDDEEIFFRAGPLALRNAGVIYAHIKDLPKDEPLNLDGTLTVGDLLIDESNFEDCRDRGIDGETRLLVVERIDPKSIDPSLPRIGYLAFREVSSKDNAKALFFLVKLTEPTQNKKFRNLAVGETGIASKHKHIVLLGKWMRLPNCPLHAYYAEINSRCYAFID